MDRLLSPTRYVVLLGVIASLLIAVALFVAIVVRAALLVAEVVAHIGDEKAVRAFAIGEVRLPDWLVITSLDDLKSKLIGLIVVVLGVSFLAQAATWDGKTNLLPFGLALAVVMVALSVFGALRLGRHTAGTGTSSDNHHPE